MPHTRKRASLQPRFLIESSMNGPSPNAKAKARTSSRKLPVDIQIFRLMGTTVANSAQEYPLLFPDFVSRFITSNSDETDPAEAKLRSWKILSELNQLKQQQMPSSENNAEVISQLVNETPGEGKSLPVMADSSSVNSLSSIFNSQGLDQRNTQQFLAFAQAKVSGGQRKLLARTLPIKDPAILSQTLAVGGKGVSSLSRPTTPGVPVPFVRGIASYRSNSISATAAPASSKAALNAPVYAQLLNSAPVISSANSMSHSHSVSLSHKPLIHSEPLQRGIHSSNSFGSNEHLINGNGNVNGNTYGQQNASVPDATTTANLNAVPSNPSPVLNMTITNGNNILSPITTTSSANNFINPPSNSILNTSSSNLTNTDNVESTRNSRSSNISATAAMAFSRGVRQSNNNPNSGRNNPLAPKPVAATSGVSRSSGNQAATHNAPKYPDPLQGLANPSPNPMNELFRKRLNEISQFAEQTIRFEMRKANRIVLHRSSGAAASSYGITGTSVPISSSSNNLSGIAPSPAPSAKYFNRNMSPIEPRRTKQSNVGPDSDDDEEDDSDTS